MSKADRKVRLQRRDAQVKVIEARRMMAKAADVIDKQSANIKAVQERNEFWRNLLVASAWDSVTGMERPISSVIRECAPALMGNGALFGVSNAPLRDGEPGVISVRP